MADGGERGDRDAEARHELLFDEAVLGDFERLRAGTHGHELADVAGGFDETFEVDASVAE